MARRADWDTDDDFEILPDTSPMNIQQTSKSRCDDDCFGIVPHENKSISTNSITSHIEKPTEVVKPTDDKVKLLSTTPVNYLPVRYGSAAKIPYGEEFDLKSILDSKPSLLPADDLIIVLRDSNLQKPSSMNNDLNKLFLDFARDRENLIQVAKQTQQDFINAIHLD